MNNIKLIGSYLREEENFSPEGIHLRWNLPANQSDMDYSFEIYRQICLAQNVSGREYLENASSLSGIDSSLKMKIIENAQILLQFKEPLVYIKLSLSPSSNYRKRTTRHSRSRFKTPVMKFYYQNVEVASVTDLKTLSIKNVQFDTVLLTLENSEINHIEFLTVTQYCQSKNWGKALVTVNKAANKNEISEKLKGVINRYAPPDLTLDDLTNVYFQKLEKLEELEALGSRIGNRTDDTPVKIMLDSSPDDFRKIFHIAATDPNMARVLGLYYVDATANPNECYNYKIVIEQDEVKNRCGLLLNVHGVTEALESSSLLKYEQARGFTWKKREPLAKVDLFWEPVVWNRNKIQPLYYDVKRDDELITHDAPIPSYRKKDKKDIAAKHLFTDEALVMGKYFYESRSIDIFGRVSKYTKFPEEVVLEDLLPPPPPVRLKAAVNYSKEDNKYTGIFSFEYGYHQHKQAPDAKSIQLYWREHSLMLRETGEVKGCSDFSHNRKIEFNDLNHDELLPFIGGTISLDTSQKIVRHRPVNIKAPNSQRQSYTIIDVDGNAVIVKGIVADDNFSAGDMCELRSAKENRANWIKLGFDTTINSPKADENISFSNPRVILRHLYQNTEYQNGEACINLDILEPDLFKNYTLDGKVILFSTVGSDKDDNKPYLRAHLGFDSDAIDTLAEDKVYELVPAQGNPDAWLIKAVHCTNSIQPDIIGGEVAFEFDDDQVIIARVVGYESDEKYLLVKLRKQDLDTLESKKVFATYYASYLISDKEINILSPGDEVSDKVPFWINYPEDQVLKGYIAASAIDDRDNESELSLPAEVSTIKPPSFPASLNAPMPEILNENKGMATPPNFEGKSFVKLLWSIGGDNVEGQRLEVVRVLDSTLLLGVRKIWLNGEDINGPMIPVLPSISGTIKNTPSVKSNGSIEIIFTPNELIADLNIALNGRMKIKRLSPTPNECVQAAEIPDFATFKIINVSKNENEEHVLMLSPVNGRSEEFINLELDKDTCIIDILPNFDNLAKIDAFLAMLANNPSNSDLFTIASKVPVLIENNSAIFIDEIPGIGSNRFFYKVRLVDVADNRSDWSPCSVPVYQLDTTPPEPVKNLQVIHVSDEKILVSWDVSEEEGLWGYNIAGEEIAKEDLRYKQQSTPLDQILFSQSIDISVDTADTNYLENTLDSLQLSIIEIHNPEESLNPAYDYIYDIDDSDGSHIKLLIKGIFFYEEQSGNFVVTVTKSDGEETYTTEGFDRNRWAALRNRSENDIEISAIKKISYKNKEIVINSKRRSKSV